MRRLLIGGSPVQGRDPALEVNDGGCPEKPDHLSPLATIVGIDVNSKCKDLEEHAIHVRIGSQDDHDFLEKVINEFGVPDIVLDDGSHQMRHIRSTFEYIFPMMKKNSVYMVEDLCCACWPECGGGLDSPDSFINIAKSRVDKLNATHSRGAVPVDLFTQTVSSISFYDAIVAIEKNSRVDGYAAIGNHSPVWDPRKK